MKRPWMNPDDGDTLVAPATEPVLDHGDHDLYAHYVSHEQLEHSILYGEKATALCGKKWLPTKDAARFPVCPTCKEIYMALPSGDNINNETPMDDA